MSKLKPSALAAWNFASKLPRSLSLGPRRSVLLLHARPVGVCMLSAVLQFTAELVALLVVQDIALDCPAFSEAAQVQESLAAQVVGGSVVNRADQDGGDRFDLGLSCACGIQPCHEGPTGQRSGFVGLQNGTPPANYPIGSGSRLFAEQNRLPGAVLLQGKVEESVHCRLLQ